MALNAVTDFIRDIGNFFHGGSALGIDIGTTAIKAMEVRKTGDIFSLENYALLETKDYLEHPNQAIQKSSLKPSENDLVATLKLLLRDMRPKSKLAIASLPSFSTFSTLLDFPALSDAETDKAIGFQAAQFIPLPIAEVTLEWRRIGEYADKEGVRHQRVLLVAVPNDVIKIYTNIFKRAGLKLIALEAEAFSLARALRGSFSEAPTLIVDIGGVSTGISVLAGGRIEYMTQTDYSGVYLTQALSRSLEISMSRAEELKKRRGLIGGEADSEIGTMLTPFLDVIMQETRRAIDSYQKNSGKKVEKIALAGGGANLLGIEKYFGSQFGIPLAHHSFTGGLSLSPLLTPARKEMDNRFAVAYGCARRYFK